MFLAADVHAHVVMPVSLTQAHLRRLASVFRQTNIHIGTMRDQGRVIHAVVLGPADHEVAWLQIPVNDGAGLLVVHVGQPPGCVNADLHSPPYREWLLQAHGIRQRAPRHELCD